MEKDKANRTERHGPGRKAGRGGKGKRKDVVIFRADPSATNDADGCTQPLADLLLCVDDTDDLTAATSTGYVAELIAQEAVQLGGRIKLGITRHQLLIAEGVPYTSHNSAMCFSALIPPDAIGQLRQAALRILARECAPTSDPGLCIAVLPDDAPDAQLQTDLARLEAFGRTAQIQICPKQQPYVLAAAIPWVQLSEHGGTGAGVIGALAGTGLRLTGEDGRFRGNWNLHELLANCTGNAQSRTMPAGDFCSVLSHLAGGPVRIMGMGGEAIPHDTDIALVPEAKAVFKGNALTFVARMHDGTAYPGGKADVDAEGSAAGLLAVCPRFAFDNDVEEQLATRDPSCGNCLYRRWTSTGFECIAAIG